MRAGTAYYPYWGYLFSASQDGYVIDIVYAEDGTTVYFKDLIAMAGSGTWVEGLLSDDGKKITIESGTVYSHYEDDTYNYNMLLKHMNYYMDENGVQTFVPDNDPITLTVDGDVISVDNTQVLGGAIGLVYEAPGQEYDGSWSGYCDSESVFTLFDNTPVEDPSATTQVLDYAFAYGEGTTKCGFRVKAAFDGDNVYVQGIAKAAPEAWFKGTVEGDKVVFPADQLIGIVDGRTLFFVCAKLDSVYNADYDFWYTRYGYRDQVVFSYDAESRTLTDATAAIVVNVVKGDLRSVETYDMPALSAYEEVPGTPADPTFTEYFAYYPDAGYGYIQFHQPVFDTEGRLMDVDKLSFRFFIDGEPFVFGPDEYPGVETILGVDETDEIPYTYVDQSILKLSRNTAVTFMRYYFDGAESFGVQSVYRGGGEEHTSNIVTYIDPTAGIDAPQGISERRNDQPAGWFDLYGRRLTTAPSAHGLYIVNGKKVIVK